jgi:uracil-DNA glycosylase
MVTSKRDSRHRRSPVQALQFSATCRACPRIAAHLASVRTRHPDYHARPVAPFGDARARFLVVGLAPGLHGANRTGRPFTGDFAGELLYATLHRHGFASQPWARSAGDGLQLLGCRITNAVKCLPPQNKPESGEVSRCNAYLRGELAALPPAAAILALGRIAHAAILKALLLPQQAYPFAHGAQFRLPAGLKLYDSYHCSRYNTQTRRLTAAMFDEVVGAIAKDLAASSPDQPRRL